MSDEDQPAGLGSYGRACRTALSTLCSHPYLFLISNLSPHSSFRFCTRILPPLLVSQGFLLPRALLPQRAKGKQSKALLPWRNPAQQACASSASREKPKSNITTLYSCPGGDFVTHTTVIPVVTPDDQQLLKAWKKMPRLTLVRRNSFQ